jgi:cytoskeletal protein CcmA (bactofilin family)
LAIQRERTGVGKRERAQILDKVFEVLEEVNLLKARIPVVAFNTRRHLWMACCVLWFNLVCEKDGTRESKMPQHQKVLAPLYTLRYRKEREVVMQTFRILTGRRQWLLVGIVLLVALVAVPSARAADTRSGDQIIIGANDVVNDDLYAFANTVTIDGTVKGDVIAFAQQVTINGTVEGDLFGAAQVITIRGTVNDDARIAGQVVMLDSNARVGSDVLAASYSLEQKSGSTAGGDMYYAGYQALVAGSIGRDLVGAAQALAIRGTIARNVSVDVGGDQAPPQATSYMAPVPIAIPVVPPGLTVDETARIGGQLSYRSRVPANIHAGARVEGRVIQAAPPVAATRTSAERGILDVAIDNLRRLLALLVVGLVLLWIVPGLTRNLANTVQDRPLPSLGWGIVALVVFFVAVVAIVLVTIILAVILGIVTLGDLVPLILGLGALVDAALIVGFLIFVSYIAEVVVSYLIGRWLLERIRPGLGSGRVLPLVTGLVLFVILTAIPVLGGVIGLIVDLLVLGALWIWSLGIIQPALTRRTVAPA